MAEKGSSKSKPAHDEAPDSCDQEHEVVETAADWLSMLRDRIRASEAHMDKWEIESDGDWEDEDDNSPPHSLAERLVMTSLPSETASPAGNPQPKKKLEKLTIRIPGGKFNKQGAVDPGSGAEGVGNPDPPQDATSSHPSNHEEEQEQPPRHIRRREKENEKKARKRKAKQDDPDGGLLFRVRTSLRKRFNCVLTLKVDASLGEDIKACKGAYQGLKRSETGEKCPSLNELLEANVEILKWDGSVPVIVLDNERRIIAVLVPPPKDSGRDGEEPWSVVIEGAYRALERCCRRLQWSKGFESLPKPSSKKRAQNRRGNYKSFSLGWSMGPGSRKPGCFNHTHKNEQILDEYRQNKHVRRLMRFANSVFGFYFPKLFRRYRKVMKALCAHPRAPGCHPPFPDAVFGAHSGNEGPSAYTYLHEDFLNLAYGICAVQSLGKFDHTKGGHLYFPQLGFATQFPAGCTILLPSAALTHGNVPISSHEHRASLVHYTPAGLFRYVDYGFQTKTEKFESFAKDEDARAWLKEDEAKNEERLAKALSMFSTPESLFSDHKLVFGKPYDGQK